mmetsp:Transcript_17890/g.50395  ORF Transcript_17890/g.50395 Transcript_17890/m.50395 type:complete len:217 (+) Transcript_17890:197-847(+)
MLFIRCRAESSLVIAARPTCPPPESMCPNASGFAWARGPYGVRGRTLGAALEPNAAFCCFCFAAAAALCLCCPCWALLACDRGGVRFRLSLVSLLFPRLLESFLGSFFTPSLPDLESAVRAPPLPCADPPYPALTAPPAVSSDDEGWAPFTRAPPGRATVPTRPFRAPAMAAPRPLAVTPATPPAATATPAAATKEPFPAIASLLPAIPLTAEEGP